jgi:hypothetical protein
MYDPKKIKSLKEKQNDTIRKQWKYKRLFQKCQDKQHRLGTKIEALENNQRFVAS